jgi:hypothetical protein
VTAVTPGQAAYEAAPLGWVGHGVWPPAPYSRLDPGDRGFWERVGSAAAGVPQMALAAETFRREGAEGKLAEAVLMLGEIRETVANFLGQYGDSQIPMFRVGQDLANAVLKIIDADAPADDDESARPPRPAATEGSEP